MTNIQTAVAPSWCRLSAEENHVFKFRLVQLPLLFLALVPQANAQFAHTDHKQIVESAGKPLLVRAMNLGIGWCQKVTCGCSKVARNLPLRSERW